MKEATRAMLLRSMFGRMMSDVQKIAQLSGKRTFLFELNCCHTVYIELDDNKPPLATYLIPREVHEEYRRARVGSHIVAQRRSKSAPGCTTQDASPQLVKRPVVA